MIIDTDDEAVVDRLAQHLYAQYVRRQHLTPAWDQQDEPVRYLWRRDAREALEVAAQQTGAPR